MFTTLNEILELAKMHELNFEIENFDLDSNIELISEVAVPNNANDGDIYICRIYYDNITPGLDPNNKKEYKDRRCILYNDPDFGWVAIRCSKVELQDKQTGHVYTTDELNRMYNTDTRVLFDKNWRNEGFSQMAYALVTDVRKLKNITFIAYNNKNHHLEKDDLKKVLSKFENFKEVRYSVIERVTDALKLEKPKERKSAAIRDPKMFQGRVMDSISDIELISFMNSLGFGLKINFRILWTKLKNAGKEVDHFTFISYNRHTNTSYSLRYFAALPGRAETHRYQGKKLDACINEESKWVADYYPNGLINRVKFSRFLTIDELKLLYKFTMTHKTDDEFKAELNKMNSHKPKNLTISESHDAEGNIVLECNGMKTVLPEINSPLRDFMVSVASTVLRSNANK